MCTTTALQPQTLQKQLCFVKKIIFANFRSFSAVYAAAGPARPRRAASAHSSWLALLHCFSALENSKTRTIVANRISKIPDPPHDLLEDTSIRVWYYSLLGKRWMSKIGREWWGIFENLQYLNSYQVEITEKKPSMYFDAALRIMLVVRIVCRL